MYIFKNLLSLLYDLTLLTYTFKVFEKVSRFFNTFNTKHIIFSTYSRFENSNFSDAMNLTLLIVVLANSHTWCLVFLSCMIFYVTMAH